MIPIPVANINDSAPKIISAFEFTNIIFGVLIVGIFKGSESVWEEYLVSFSIKLSYKPYFRCLHSKLICIKISQENIAMKLGPMK